MNDVYFVNKGVEHLCNRYDISFSLKNKLFNHLRGTCRKFKTIIEAPEAAFDIITPITNNAKVVTIIHFIAKLRDVIVKPGYNFRN